MKRAVQATRIGLFIGGAIAVLVAAVLLLSEGGPFTRKDKAIGHFQGSVYGLQVGAPVVFRGVRIGSVTDVGLSYLGRPGQFVVPVHFDVERKKLDGVRLHDLLPQGLTAQLSTQSLLTGLLYVDLDLRPGARALRIGQAAAASAAAAPAGTPIEVPTHSTPLQALQDQLAKLDVETLVADVRGVATSARSLVGDPALKQAIADASGAAADLKRVLAQIDRRVGPLADALQGTLGTTRRTVERIGGTAERFATTADKADRGIDQVGRAADRVSDTMGRVDRLADSAQPTLESVRQAAADLAQTSAALRAATSEDSGAMQQFERAAQDIARASRAVRDLADLLERQPEALIRGRASNP